MWLVSLTNVSFERERKSILSHISFDIKPGEITTLIGPNGAGKTTLVKLILGLLKPLEGNIKKKAGLKIGYMPQNLSLDPFLPMTVGRFLGATQPPSLLNDLGISHLSKNSLHGLSGGEYQRVLLARALLKKPDLLILDEPAQGVDTLGQDEIYGLLDHLKKKNGCSILLVSHDLYAVMATSDQVICLNGHICCAGHPLSVQENPLYTSLFGSHLKPYHHQHDHHHG